MLLRKVCAGTVAVVGNGPLSNADRRRIETHDCIVRFNDLKHWKRRTERVTVHASRFHYGAFPGMDRTPASTPFWPIATTLRRADTVRAVRNVVLPPILVYERTSLFENDLAHNATFFVSCTECCDGVRNASASQCACLHRASYHGPSSGALVIDELQKQPFVSRIDVYGMNWNGGIGHVDFARPTLVRRCCVKCTIHPTPVSVYDDTVRSPRIAPLLATFVTKVVTKFVSNPVVKGA